MTAAFKAGGEAALRKALVGIAPTGSVKIGAGNPTPTRFTVERPTSNGRLLTILTDQPLAFVGAGVPGAKPKEGYNIAVIDIEVDAKGSGSGSLAPAAKIKMNGDAFVVDDYGTEAVRVDGGQEDQVRRSVRHSSQAARDGPESGPGPLPSVPPSGWVLFGPCSIPAPGRRPQPLTGRERPTTFGDPPRLESDARPFWPGNRDIAVARLVRFAFECPSMWSLKPSTPTLPAACRWTVPNPPSESTCIRSGPAAGPSRPLRLASITERARLDHAVSEPLRERLDFEQLVGELSMRFIDLPPADVDAAIQEAQRRIVEALGFDGSTLFQLSEDGDLVHTHSWWCPEVSALPAHVSARESFPWMLEKLRAGELVCLSSPDELPDGVDRASLLRFDIKSTVAVPLSVARRIVGVVTFAVTRRERQWPPETLQRVRLVASMFASVLARWHSDEALGRALAEVKRLGDQLHAENVYLRREVESTLGTSAVVGQSAAIQQGAGAGAPGGRDRCDSPPPRRDRLRQGAVRIADSRAEPPPRPGDGPRQLRGHPRHADRKRAVRARERRLHRGPVAPDRALRARRRIDDLPGRDWRPAARRPGQAPARAGGEADRAAGQLEVHQSRHANHRRHASGSRETDRGRHVP